MSTEISNPLPEIKNPIFVTESLAVQACHDAVDLLGLGRDSLDGVELALSADPDAGMAKVVEAMAEVVEAIDIAIETMTKVIASIKAAVKTLEAVKSRR